jgi:hypothetical protein
MKWTSLQKDKRGDKRSSLFLHIVNCDHISHPKLFEINKEILHNIYAIISQAWPFQKHK